MTSVSNPGATKAPAPARSAVRAPAWPSHKRPPRPGRRSSGQTTTMANFATLADARAGCATQVVPVACDRLFQAAKSPKGDTPTDTLAAAQTIARAPWYLPNRLFGVLDFFYPVPVGRNLGRVRCAAYQAQQSKDSERQGAPRRPLFPVRLHVIALHCPLPSTATGSFRSGAPPTTPPVFAALPLRSRRVKRGFRARKQPAPLHASPKPNRRSPPPRRKPPRRSDQRLAGERRRPGRLAVIEDEGEVAATAQAHLRRQVDGREAGLPAQERHQRAQRAGVGPAGEIMVVVAGDEGRDAVATEKRDNPGRLFDNPGALEIYSS